MANYLLTDQGADNQIFLRKALGVTDEWYKENGPIKLSNKYLVTDGVLPPYPILRGILFDDYTPPADPDTTSITAIINPLRISWYKKNMPKDMVQDLGSSSALLVGNGVHKQMEAANNHFGGEVEKEYIVDVGDYKLRVIVDMFHNGLNTDYKTSLMSQLFYGSSGSESPDNPDYILQLKAQMYAIKKSGLEVHHSYLASIGKDHNYGSVVRGASTFYQKNYKSHLYPYDENIEAWIKMRVPAYFSAVRGDLADVPMCTDEERFVSNAAYKVYKSTNGKQNKSAMPSGTFSTKNNPQAERQAQAFIQDWLDKGIQANKKGITYESKYISGGYMRCQAYCPARMVCEKGALFGKELREV